MHEPHVGATRLSGMGCEKRARSGAKRMVSPQWASAAPMQIARKALSHPGFGAMASSASLRGWRIV